jgi:hypothetical protein
MPLSPFSKYRRDVKSTPGHDHNAKPIPADQALTLPDDVTVSPTALVCSRQLTIDEWKSLGCTLWQLEGSIKWWIGDWWHYGFHRYGDRKAVATAKKTFGGKRSYAFQTLMNYGYVAGRVQTSRRREVLSFSHHVVVAPLEPEEQERWLSAAVEGGLSVAKLEQKMFEDGHPGGKFTEDERTRHYLRRLVDEARVSPRVTFGGPPWENSSLEDYLERNCHLPPGLAKLAEVFEEAAAFWSNTAQFVRRIGAKAPQHDNRGAATDLSALSVVPLGFDTQPAKDGYDYFKECDAVFGHERAQRGGQS